MEEKGQEKLYQDAQSSEKGGNDTDKAGSSLCGESPRNQTQEESGTAKEKDTLG